MKLSELFTNNKGEASTTSTIQLLSWLVVSAMLIYAVVTGAPHAREWLDLYLALCVFGSPMTKGIASAIIAKREIKNE